LLPDGRSQLLYLLTLADKGEIIWNVGVSENALVNG
jgi:hypothetical protein